MERQKINNLKTEIWDFLDYRPRAKMGQEIEKQFKDKLKEEEFGIAMNELLQEKRVCEINGWYWKQNIHKEVELSQDDIEWLTGTGRFSQS